MVSTCPNCGKVMNRRISGSTKKYSVQKYCKHCGYIEPLIETDGGNMNVAVEVFKNGSKISGEHSV